MPITMSLFEFTGRSPFARKLPENPFKTRVCQSVYRKKTCSYGSRCRFAHSSKEMNIRECENGENCYNDNCVWFHPKSETKHDYFDRLGISSDKKFVRFKEPIEEVIPNESTEKTCESLSSSKSFYDPPKDMPFLKCPIDFSTNKELCSLIIGKNGFHFKEITRLSGSAYIWLKSHESTIEIWGHTHAIHMAYDMLSLHIQTMKYQFDQTKNYFGETMYPIVESITNDQIAGKIVGMLLELKNPDISNLLQSKYDLVVKVNEALDVLTDAIENGDTITIG